MTDILDVRWPVTAASEIPLDHRYSLLSALSRLAPAVHRESGVGVQQLRGIRVAPGRLQLHRDSGLTVRAPLALLKELLPLSGQSLDLQGSRVRLGVPQLHTLNSAAEIASPLATIKGFLEPQPFEEAARRQLRAMAVRDEVRVAVGQRRAFRIKGRVIVGFAMRLEGLSDDESLAVQRIGVGGRRHLGCGIFNAVRPNHSEAMA